MNLPFAYLVNIALLTRLPLLLPDGPVRGRRMLAATVVQFVALLALAPTLGVALAAAVIAAVNVLMWRRERGRTRGSSAGRLVALVMTVVSYGVLCSPVFQLRFRPDLGMLADSITAFFFPAGLLQTVQWSVFHSCLLGALLCLNEVNLLVRLLIETYGLRPPEGESQAQNIAPGGREYNRGRIIGLLERLITFLLVLEAQYDALGFVMAIKGLARFKNLDDREFAEYFLIGTMLSIVLAGGIALIVRHALQ